MVGRLLARRGILAEREAQLRIRLRELLERLARTLERFGADAAEADRRRLADAVETLDGFFLLVVAGEFNSGKSSVINALLGERVLPEGVTPTTDRINVLRHGPREGERLVREQLLERTHPAAVLGDLSIVDTPGTNAIIRAHEELTRDFVPRSDLIVFVTSADRPFTESERSFLEQVRDWGKKVVFVLNKVDILETPAEVEEVVAFVSRHAEALLGTAPPVFALSARAAMRARGAGDDAAFQASGMAAFETFLIETLDAEERVRLKLLNPLGVAARLAAGYRERAFERLKLLADDLRAIENVDRQLAAFHQEMLRDLEPRLAAVDSLLQGMELRGQEFFDERVRIGRIRGLLNSDETKKAFQRDVVADVPKRVEAEVDQIIDWLVERNLRLWQDVEAYVDRRRIAEHADDMVGDVGRSFAYNRQELLGSIGRVASESVARYDRDGEARALANEVHASFATTALVEAGAVGLGALVVTLAAGAAVDVTGILLAATVAVGGFYVIPAKRRRVKAEFARAIEMLRSGLRDALTRQVHRELDAARGRVDDAIGPYRRFVTSQREQLAEARDELVVVDDELRRLRIEIER